MMFDLLPQSLTAVVKEVADLINNKASFTLSSVTRVFNPSDEFNQAFFEDTDIKYPFLSYQTKSISLAIDRIGSVISRNKPVSLASVQLQDYPNSNIISYKTNLTGDRITQAQLKPVTCDIVFAFTTDTPSQFDEFVQLWLQYFHPSVSFIFTVKGEEFPVTFQAVVDNINFPEKDVSDRGTVYRGEVSATMTSFIGALGDVSLIKEIPQIDSQVLQDAQGNTLANVVKLSTKV